MGFYIEATVPQEKSKYLLQLPGAELVSPYTARREILAGTAAIVCVLYRSSFDAAGYCYDEQELDRFLSDADFVKALIRVPDQLLIENMSGFTGSPAEKERKRKRLLAKARARLAASN